MGLQINTNVGALNAYRNLTGTQGSMQTSLERLSSGLRINRAADDAAGLAISEKLRSQVNGLNQAKSNAQDGVSLIQTAEGAMNETHAILQRMRTLAVQAGTDTNTASDRRKIQAEIKSLTNEIQGISARTQFNGMSLIDGSHSAATQSLTLQIGANSGQTMRVQMADLGVKGLNLGTVATADKAATPATNVNAVQGSSATTAVATAGAVSDPNGTIAAATYTLAAGGKVTVDGEEVGTWVTDKITFADGASLAYSANPLTEGNTVTITAGGKPAEVKGEVNAFSLDLSTRTGANAALAAIDSAIERVSTQRSDLGALQNRLSHTINNLGVSAENLASSESRIRDTDMAKEMTNFTRSQILQQAGVSMLAQANQSQQSVLKLLG